MLELRRRNLTYKQIGKELDVSPSIVGKLLKEVRDNPELSLEFIKLTNFETGQTVLSFTPEDFEKYRRSSTLYYLDLQLFDIREGLIHSTKFTNKHLISTKPSRPLPEWYGDLIKLYDKENWSSSILNKHNNYKNRVTEWKILKGEFVKYMGFVTRDDDHVRCQKIETVLAGISKMCFTQITHMMEEIRNVSSDLHWLNDGDLMQKADLVTEMITTYENASSELSLKINYCLSKITTKSKPTTMQDIHDAFDQGWELNHLAINNHSNIHPRIGFENWIKCNLESISFEQWVEMDKLGIKDYDYYLRIRPWMETNLNHVMSIIGESFSTLNWLKALQIGKIDYIIERLEELGWNVKLVNAITQVGKVGRWKDSDVSSLMSELSMDEIIDMSNSLSYCEENLLIINSDAIDWFEENKWKIPKLKNGFTSYIAKEIYDVIKKEKSNYIDVKDLVQLFNESKSPKNHSRFSSFYQVELSKAPFNSICTGVTLRGEISRGRHELILIKPVTAELLTVLNGNGLSLDQLKNMDLTKVKIMMENLEKSNIQFTTEIAKWAMGHDWDIPDLGGFNTFRDRRLYLRFSEFEIPAVRLDKMLAEYNKFPEPGPILEKEDDLHKLLLEHPFNEICKSSNDAGMIFFEEAPTRKNISPIIEERIVIKEVIVKEEVLVEKDTYVDNKVNPLVDLSSFPMINNSNDDYVKRVVGSVNKSDLLGTINDVWRLLRIKAVQLIGEHTDRKENFNVKLVDDLAIKMKLNERQHKKLHQLRRARNDFDKGTSESPIKPSRGLVNNGLEIIEQMLSLN